MLVSLLYCETLKLLADIHCSAEQIVATPADTYKRILSRTTLDGMLGELYVFLEQICDFLEKNIRANQNAAERGKLYIENHFAQAGLTLDMVAGELGISPNYFSALFKQSTGQSFITYLTSVRLEHAKQLLATGGYRAYEVALLCGYENATYFSTIFKRHVGVPPTEFHPLAQSHAGPEDPSLYNA